MPPILAVSEIDKKFGSQQALSKLSLQIEAGEVHALVGENGAGKSTLIKILTGVYAKDAGELIWGDQPVTIENPVAASKLGIHVVHQDRQLIPQFTGLENLYLGKPYPKRFAGFGVNWQQMRQEAITIRDRWNIRLDLDKLVSEMTPPEQTMLEILKAMMNQVQLLIFDEPTAALTDQESVLLFELIKHLQGQGTAILYVSHRMDEIFQISDRITVLRNGQVVSTKQTAQTTQPEIVSLMSGTDAPTTTLQRNELKADTQTVLEVSGLSTIDGRVKDTNLLVRKGEIVGVFGLAGAGRTELLEAIYGLRQIQTGAVTVDGEQVRRFSPREMLARKVVLIPEDRRGQAMMMQMSIRENMTLPVLQQFVSLGRIQTGQEKAAAQDAIKLLKVKATSSEQPVQELSGGNQQKVVFAKALLSEPTLFLCDEPTQAVDVMTRAEIHQLLQKQTHNGCGVLYVSSDLKEILDVADRIYVFRDGQTVAELKNEQVTAEEILQICFAGHQGDRANNGN